eukprot:COSAG01_NODE_64144_length_278_cov_1.303371_1_plen_48_part_01
MIGNLKFRAEEYCLRAASSCCTALPANSPLQCRKLLRIAELTDLSVCP